MLTLLRLPAQEDRNRHDHTVRRFSADADLLVRLETVGADRSATSTIVDLLASSLGVTRPDVTFHARRGPHTGYCMAPRRLVVAKHGAAAVRQWEAQKRSPWPINGMIRLGDPTSLATIAHEFGHHLVHVADRPATPTHGKVWVSRFDQAAAVVAGSIGPLR